MKTHEDFKKNDKIENQGEQTYFRMVAYTDAAGKYNPEAYRNGNEDNFYVDDNLSDDKANHFEADKVLPLDKYGLLMAVADGMGGMNAGEVASEIAVNTIKEMFAPEKITDAVASSHEARKAYLESVIVEADKRIKTDTIQNPEHSGMGSTIILAWLYKNELTISWCGDSRAYLFNQQNGIRLISEDHSYVQELVKKGMLTYEQTFDHPQNNIVMRSLGDPNQVAVPESRLFQVGKGDIILICSDGLSGVLRDKKIVGDNGQFIDEPNLEDIIRTHTESMTLCREALWRAAENADWYDNVTAILCQIVDGEAAPAEARIRTAETHPLKKRLTVKNLILFGACVLFVVLAFLLINWRADIFGDDEMKQASEIIVPVIDSSTADTAFVALDETTSVEEQIEPVSDKRSPEEDLQIDSSKPNAETVSNSLTELREKLAPTPIDTTKTQPDSVAQDSARVEPENE